MLTLHEFNTVSIKDVPIIFPLIGFLGISLTGLKGTITFKYFIFEAVRRSASQYSSNLYRYKMNDI